MSARTKRAIRVPLPFSDRDGPTEAFKQHHDTVGRRGSVGQRVYSRAEQLMDAEEISPQEFAACLRYSRDYSRGIIGSSTVVTFRNGPSGGGGMVSEERLDSTRAHREAAAVLDAIKDRSAIDPSEAMVMFAHEDASFRDLGQAMSADHKTAKGRILVYISELAEHYERIDREYGRSVTPYTRIGARMLIDPEDKPIENAGRAARR